MEMLSIIYSVLHPSSSDSVWPVSMVFARLSQLNSDDLYLARKQMKLDLLAKMHQQGANSPEMSFRIRYTPAFLTVDQLGDNMMFTV